MTNNTAVTSFNHLATETILHMFEYLSCNDIIYIFFDFNQRLNSIILKYQYILKNFETPITNFYFWDNILPIIGIQIQCLTITTIKFNFSLKLFPNLKSIIINSPNPIDHHRLYSILVREQFKKLNSFKIKSEICYNLDNYTTHKKHLFENIIHSENSLKTFEYLSTLVSRDFQCNHIQTINTNIHSLSLKVFKCYSLNTIFHYTPNLKDLKFIGNPCYSISSFYTPFSNIKLEKFYFIAPIDDSIYWRCENFIFPLIRLIKAFSSSLIYLSIDLSQKVIVENDDFEFNGITLQQKLLESMIKLEILHFYIKLNRSSCSSTFQNQFWFDHNWSIGTHENYLYTLPFHFDRLDDFINFDNIESNNSNILNSSQIWYHVKSIDLSKSYSLNLDLIKQLKIKMPNLISITLNSKQINDLYTNKIDTTLDSITTIYCKDEFIENIKPSLIDVFPNVKHLVFTYSPQMTTHSSNRMKFLQIFRRYFRHDQITDYVVYFPKIQDIEIELLLKDVDNLHNSVLHLVKNLLKTMENLKFFIIKFYRIISDFVNQPFFDLDKMITLLNMNEISKNYQIKCVFNEIQFVKKEQINNYFI